MFFSLKYSVRRKELLILTQNLLQHKRPLRKYTTLSAGGPWASSNYRSVGSHSAHFSRRSLRVFPSLVLCFATSSYLLLDYQTIA